MPSCVVKWCQNNAEKSNKKSDVTFHRFPIDPLLAHRWTTIIRQTREDNWIPHRTSAICSKHFSSDATYFTNKGLRRLKKGAVPSKCLFISVTDTPTTNIQLISTTESDEFQHSLEEEITDEETDPLETSGFENIDEYYESFEATIPDLIYGQESPQELYLSKKLEKSRKSLRIKNDKVRNLNQQVIRLTQKNKLLKNLISAIKKRNKLNIN